MLRTVILQLAMKSRIQLLHMKLTNMLYDSYSYFAGITMNPLCSRFFQCTIGKLGVVRSVWAVE